MEEILHVSDSPSLHPSFYSSEFYSFQTPSPPTWARTSPTLTRWCSTRTPSTCAAPSNSAPRQALRSAQEACSVQSSCARRPARSWARATTVSWVRVGGFRLRPCTQNAAHPTLLSTAGVLADHDPTAYVMPQISPILGMRCMPTDLAPDHCWRIGPVDRPPPHSLAGMARCWPSATPVATWGPTCWRAACCTPRQNRAPCATPAACGLASRPSISEWGEGTGCSGRRAQGGNLSDRNSVWLPCSGSERMPTCLSQTPIQPTPSQSIHTRTTPFPLPQWSHLR